MTKYWVYHRKNSKTAYLFRELKNSSIEWPDLYTLKWNRSSKTLQYFINMAKTEKNSVVVSFDSFKEIEHFKEASKNQYKIVENILHKQKFYEELLGENDEK